METLTAYKRDLAQHAIDAKKANGTTYAWFSRDKGIPYSTLMGWVNLLLANDKEEQNKP